MRLDVALMHRRGGVLPLDDDVCLREAAFGVALLVAEMGGNVAGLVAALAHGGGAQFLVEQRRAVFHGLADIDDGGEHLIVDLDQGQGRLGHVSVDRSDGGDRVALKQRLFAGHHVVRGELESAVVATQFLPAQRGKRQVLGCNDRLDAGQRLGLAGVNGADTGVGMRTSQHLASEQARQLQVGAVLGAPSYLVDPVGTYWPLPTILYSTSEST